jgi:hypothetical protein
MNRHTVTSFKSGLSKLLSRLFEEVGALSPRLIFQMAVNQKLHQALVMFQYPVTPTGKLG